ncbi:hypothetical protein, partial [Phenylobacterium sp.]|uniref:hypothetical protein n=1 Tax=Phenylobacterium sp. TaxID=1871053 RepID=UPI0035C7B350
MFVLLKQGSAPAPRNGAAAKAALSTVFLRKGQAAQASGAHAHARFLPRRGLQVRTPPPTLRPAARGRPIMDVTPDEVVEFWR